MDAFSSAKICTKNVFKKTKRPEKMRASLATQEPTLNYEAIMKCPRSGYLGHQSPGFLRP
jgi:hypothetical protein